MLTLNLCTPSHRSWSNAASNVTHPAQLEIAAAYPCSISPHYLRRINTPIGAASARKTWRERCGLQRESRLLIAIQHISPYRGLQVLDMEVDHMTLKLAKQEVDSSDTF
jgi:hypothetical protein